MPSPLGRSLAARGGLWAHGDFLRLWSAQTISTLGTQVTLLALPLTAILVLDATPLEVALIGAFEVVPFVLFALPAGVWIDRLPRRPILVVSDLGRAAILLSIPVAYWLDALTLPHLYVVGFLAGVAAVFFDVSYLSYLPSLVGRAQLGDANGKLEATRSATQVGGPGAAGALVGVLGAPVAILLDAISFALAALLIVRIRRPDVRPEVRPMTLRALRGEIREGVSYVLRQPFLRVLTLTTGSWNLFAHMGFGVYLVFLVRELGLTPGRVGLLIALGQVGAVVGAMTAARVARRFGLGRTLVATSLVSAASFALVPLAPAGRPEPVIVASMLIGSGFGMIFNVNQLTFRQAITPERLQGRMNSVVRLMYWGGIPAGFALGGVLAGAIGLRETLFLSAGLATAAFLPLLLHPIRRLQGIPESAPERPEEPPTAVPAPAVPHA